MDHLPDEDPSLVEQLEQYAKTNAELYTLQATDKIAVLLSSMISLLVLGGLGFILMVMLSMGIAFWIGNRMGSTYAGFLMVAAGWITVTFIVYLFRYALIRKPVMNAIISQVLKVK